jgi:hypothetical protein
MACVGDAANVLCASAINSQENHYSGRSKRIWFFCAGRGVDLIF